MKKLFALILALLFVLCSCDKADNTASDPNASSQLTQSEQGSSEISKPRPTPTFEKYVGKQDYKNLSLGGIELAQDEEKYYYTEFYNLFAIDKATKKWEKLPWDLDLFYYRYNDLLYADTGYGDEQKISVYNLKTKESYSIPFEKSLVEGFHLNPIFYMVENGFLVVGYAPEDEKEIVYYTDKQLKNKKRLDIDDVQFVLDNDVFYLGEDGNVFSYNLETSKKTYVTNYVPTPNDYEVDKLESTILEYLGNGKILVYGDGNLQIIELASGKSHTPYTANKQKKIKDVDVIYDDNNIYLLAWESEYAYRIDKISHQNYEVKTIFSGGKKDDDVMEYNTELVDVDEQYLYLEESGSFNEDGSAQGYDFRIKKDGTNKEILFHHLSADYYTAD